MGEAIEAGGSLVAITGLIVCIGLLYSAKYLAEALRALLGFSVAGIRPLGWAIDRLADLIVSGADAGIKGSERVLAGLFNGLVESLELMIGVPILLGLAVKAALVYLWNTAIPAWVRLELKPVRIIADAAKSAVASLATVVARNLAHALDYADSKAAHAISVSEGYARTVAGTARADAIRYARDAVDELRAAESVAIANAVTIAHDAIRAAHEAEQQAVTEATALAHRELAASEAAFGAALAGVKGIAVRTEEELANLYGDLGVFGAGALIASIPALATLVHTIATETGLDRAECRAKVKGVCGTDAGQWGDLLAGLGLVVGVLELRELVELARPMVRPAADFIRLAA